jgi:hypothetical protein
MNLLKKFALTFFTLFALPTLASAHVKWFVDTGRVTEASHGITPFYSWGSIEVLTWGAIVLVAVFLFSIADQLFHTPKKLLKFGLEHEKVINRISQGVLGAFLISVSILWQVVLVPELPAVSLMANVLLWIQVFTGICLLLNIFPRTASVALFGLTLGLFFFGGFEAVLENTILLSLAVYFFIVNSPDDSIFFRLNKHAVEIVRIGAGISLITMAFTEKLLYPELGMEFLAVHNWNFMQPIFPWFTNELFVLSTGFAEMIFGILFVLGYITRITTVLITIFFAASVVTMMVQFGEWEVEDLVVYSAAILFVFYGHGRTKFFHAAWPKSIFHRNIISGKNNYK